MAKVKLGDLFSCKECGLVVVVDEMCDCAATEIVCCDQPMAKGKLAADRARKKAAMPAVSPKGCSVGKGMTADVAKAKRVCSGSKAAAKKAPSKTKKAAATKK
jgi:hypothetical protein